MRWDLQQASAEALDALPASVAWYVMLWRKLVLFLVAGATIAQADARARWLRLPTENTAVFEDAPERFYMHIDRVFEGCAEKAFEGGRYGFTRTPRRIGGAVVIEVIFNLPSMGMAILSGIQNSYVLLVQGVVLVCAIGFDVFKTKRQAASK